MEIDGLVEVFKSNIACDTFFQIPRLLNFGITRYASCMTYLHNIREIPNNSNCNFASTKN